MVQYKEYKTILSPKNNMNIYRGCTHGCIYCDSRSEIYGMTSTFENIEVKKNALEILERELARKREKCMIATGAMTDPYIPLEKELCYTRQALEIIEKLGFGVTLLTKSDLILRDLDILERLNQKTRCVVQMTLTTFDEELCRIIEPHVCTTHRRYEVLKELQRIGIPTVVWLTPILPFINDTEENIRGLLDYCAQAGVAGILSFGAGLTLRYGNREYFYQRLDEHFPGLKREYIKSFGTSYGITGSNSKKLTRIIKDFCSARGIISREREVFAFCAHFPREEQLSLFD